MSSKVLTILNSQGFNYIYCNYKAEPIKTYLTKASEENCQLLCNRLADCAYYLYDRAKKVDGENICKLFSNKQFAWTCDTVVGAAHQPPLEECRSPHGAERAHEVVEYLD